jgi:hypothetical protein
MERYNYYHSCGWITGYRQFWHATFLVFLSLSNQMLGCYLKFGPRDLASLFFPNHCSLIITFSNYMPYNLCYLKSLLKKHIIVCNASKWKWILECIFHQKLSFLWLHQDVCLFHQKLAFTGLNFEQLLNILCIAIKQMLKDSLTDWLSPLTPFLCYSTIVAMETCLFAYLLLCNGYCVVVYFAVVA